MQFSTREDIEAPIGFVFDQLSDFDGFERAALRRGIEVVRTDRLSEPGPGMAWRTLFTMRGKRRRMEVTLQGYEVPGRLMFDGESKNLSGELSLDLVDLSPRRTRVVVKLDVQPLSLPARIMLQSLRLAKAKTQDKFRTRIRDQAREIEHRYRRGAA
ncbi:SRPBCC family protein [Acidimangrovimonas sediminis]|uniref:SRPBCC family protein n=1 Tax=Acidimangrovimonas sediminis TaxID=2056283 RepID=UPI000C80304D|nr:SRPBCC family protein [Acidimangrovimonas sediminis]